MDIQSPKVFISYSWDDDAHKKWARDFATRLRNDGIDATLDRWGIVPGGQLPEYMERSVRDNSFVLIVCTPQYKIKSDNRTGGVGYEGDIMTGEVFTLGNDQKFIPILRKGEWRDAAPTWLQGKYFIDLRGEPYSEDSYKELKEHLFNEREKIPHLGNRKNDIQTPKYIAVRYAKDDKDFALWLSLQLISQGFPVWCDLFNSEPGEYTQTMVENLIKTDAAKFLFVLSTSSNANSEALKELRLAYEVMQNKRLSGFVIPVQVMKIPEEEKTILLQGTSPIDFTEGWSEGLNGLFKYLEKSGGLKDENFTPSTANELWRLQFDSDKGLKNEAEDLISNWFPIELPENIYFHEIQRNGIGLLAVYTDKLPFPTIQHNIYLITFAEADDIADKLGANLSVKASFKICLRDFLDGNYDQKLAKYRIS